ncbi:MAG TPA: hypothetical protein VK557_12025 [Pyrinomonadaceae bacterium]|nr:hypothetical protein [Pyrinomonadaceae bacterium]
MSFRTKKIILTSLGAGFLLSWFSFIYFYYFRFQNIAPTTPNPVTGQIYQVNYHGYFFYLTKQQEITAFIPCGFAVIAFITAAVLESRWKIYETIYGKWSKPLR